MFEDIITKDQKMVIYSHSEPERRENLIKVLCNEKFINEMKDMTIDELIKNFYEMITYLRHGYTK